MTISFLEPHLAPCGGIRRIIEASNYLVNAGHTVRIYIPDRFYDSNQRGGWMKQLADVLPMRDIPKITHDIFIFNEETQYTQAKFAPAKTKVFWALHYPVLHKDSNMLRNCYHGGFHILANSNWTAECIFLELSEKPEVINGGINPEIFHVPSKEVKKDVDIIAYGATRSWKGREFAEQVAKTGGFSLRFFGDNGATQEMMHIEYARARIYLSCSWYEGWNWMSLEAMACGTPVVTNDDGGSRDYITKGYNALVYDNRDVLGAVHEATTILQDKRTREKLIVNGLQTASQYRWEKEGKKLEMCLRRFYETTKN